MTTRQQIESFREFALQQMESGADELTIDDLYQVWRSANPADRERAETVAAVKDAYADFEAGDRGQPARQELRETCQRLGIELDDQVQHAENVTAVRAALRDMEVGDRGTEMEEHLRRIREDFGLGSD